MNWSDVATALPKGLELLGGALQLAGNIVPGAGLAGNAVSGIGTIVAHALGVDATPEAVSGALVSLTPDQQAALMTVQENNKTALQQAAIAKDLEGYKTSAALIQADAADRQSARVMHSALKDKTVPILTWLVAICTLGAEAFIMLHGLPTMDVNTAIVFGRILGTLDAALMLVLSFHFGGNAGEQRSKEIIAASTPVAPK